ncbi:hypothetical protein GEMRC1_002296 [Eukaryota sp. GEM-RC1]
MLYIDNPNAPAVITSESTSYVSIFGSVVFNYGTSHWFVSVTNQGSIVATSGAHVNFMLPVSSESVLSAELESVISFFNQTNISNYFSVFGRVIFHFDGVVENSVISGNGTVMIVAPITLSISHSNFNFSGSFELFDGHLLIDSIQTQSEAPSLFFHSILQCS